MSKWFDQKRECRQFFESSNSIERMCQSYSLPDKAFLPNPNLERSYFQGNGGVPLSWNSDENIVYVDNCDSHTLVIGSTGSKRSRLIAMPTVEILGSAKESMIICDPKAEIYNRTSSALAESGYRISVLNLRNPLYSNSWNPLNIPYQFYIKGSIDRAYEFVNDIAENLTKSEISTNDPFWDNSAGSLFFGLALLLFKYCKEYNKSDCCVSIASIIKLRNLLFSNSGNEKAIWEYAKTDDFIATSLIGTVETAKDTRAGILSVFDEKMRNFSFQPNLLRLLSANDIPLDIIDDKPTAIYLVLPDEKTSYHKLVSLFIKQSYEYLIYKAQEAAEKKGLDMGVLNIRLNYILDEFSSLPTIKDFPAMITAARSRKIRFHLFVQSKHQLIQKYDTDAETIQANCSNWIFLSSRELKLLEELSSLCGVKYDDGITKPTLSITDLQRLDKDRGEVLILAGRKKPYLVILPDINCYDNNQYVPLIISEQPLKMLQTIDLLEIIEEYKSNQRTRLISQLENGTLLEHGNNQIPSLISNRSGDIIAERISSQQQQLPFPAKLTSPNSQTNNDGLPNKEMPRSHSSLTERDIEELVTIE